MDFFQKTTIIFESPIAQNSPAHSSSFQSLVNLRNLEDDSILNQNFMIVHTFFVLNCSCLHIEGFHQYSVISRVHIIVSDVSKFLIRRQS